MFLCAYLIIYCVTFISFSFPSFCIFYKNVILHNIAIGGLGLGRVLFQEEDTLLQIPDIRQSIANTVAFVFAGSYDEEAVAQSIDDIIDENAIVMFAFSTCPFCIKAKSLLIDELGVQNLKGEKL